MPRNDETPESVRKEFTNLRERLTAAIEQREATRHIPKSAECRQAKADIVEIKKELKALIRCYGESAQEAALRVKSSCAGDPLNLKKPIAHSKLYGHGIRLGQDGP